MNKRIACSVFLLSLASTALADQTAPGISVLSYLPIKDHSLLQGANQLTVTPTQTYTVRAIMVTYYNDNDGSCTNKSGACLIDNGLGNSVSLISGHSYVTTDASNFSLVASCRGFTPTKGAVYNLADNSLHSIGTASSCITGTQALSCTTSSDCGWNSSRTWNP